MHLVDDIAHRTQHRGVIRRIQIGHARVVAIHREQILGQVIGADADEVGTLRQVGNLDDGGRHLDHDADARQRDLELLLLLQFMHGAMNQRNGIVDFAHGGDHGQQNLQVVQAGGSFQHGAHLHHENFRMVQRDADTAPAQRRVVFLDREVRQILVAADVQRTHGHRLGGEGFELLAVDLALFFLAWKALAQHERNFRAVQADALGTAILGASNIGHETGVHAQRHGMAVGRDGFAHLVGIQPGHQLLLFADDVLVALAQHARGLHKDTAEIGIENHLGVVERGHRNVADANHGGNA